MNKIQKSILTLFAIFTVLVGYAQEPDVTLDGVKYYLNDGYYTVGNGEYDSGFDRESFPEDGVLHILGEIGGIPVTLIQRNAFLMSGSRILEIRMDYGITTIGERAFSYSHRVKKVIFPASLRRIEYDAFEMMEPVELYWEHRAEDVTNPEEFYAEYPIRLYEGTIYMSTAMRTALPLMGGWFKMMESYYGPSVEWVDYNPAPRDTRHKVKIGSLSGGTIIADKERADEGEIVTLTVTPDENRMISPSDLIVTRIVSAEVAQSRKRAPGYGSNIAVSPVSVDEFGSGTYQFLMPDVNVEVSAVFSPYLVVPTPNGTSWMTYYHAETGTSISLLSGLEAYYVTDVTDSDVRIQSIGSVVGGLPVLLHKTSGTFDSSNLMLCYKATHDDVPTDADGRYVGGISDLNGYDNVYVLIGDEFVRAELSVNTAFNPTKCFLTLGAAGARKFNISIGGEGATAIGTVDAELLENGMWYSLSGQKIDGKPTKKGLYIHNGRKKLVK